MDQLVQKMWENPSLGLRKELLKFEFQNIVKANELSTVFVVFSDVNLPASRHSEYLKTQNSESLVKLGNALTPVDWYIEKFLQEMLVGEESRCFIRTKSEEISFTVAMKRIEHGGDWHEKSFSEILTLAKQYKEHGVKMFKQFPVQFAHFYFAKAAKCLLMYKPFGDLEERAKNENVDAAELIPLLRNIYTNIAACLLKQNRINDVIDLLGFVEWAEEPVPEKAVYRLATAYFSKKDYDKARDVIKKLPNYAENKELMALLAKINQESKAGDEKYANMVKKMFQ